MAAFNGVRVLPDMPKMEILIQEFKTDLTSSNHQNGISESSTSSGGSFVKKIVEAYESTVRASIKNAEQENITRKSGLFNTRRTKTKIDQKNVKRSDSSLSICGELGSSLRRWTNLKNPSEISPVSSVDRKHDLEDDFVMPNQCHSKNDKKTDILKTGISSKIRKNSFMRELTNIRPNFSQKSETETREQKESQIFFSPPESEEKHKLKNYLPLICSSPLEDVDKNMIYNEDPLDDILTNSHDSSNASNNSYKNLQVHLYDFESEKWNFELSSTSSQSLTSSSRSLYDDTSSHTNDSLLLESSFQDITIIPSTDVLSKIHENPPARDRDSQMLDSSSDLNRESPRVIGVSLKQPIKIDNDTSLTWIPVLDQKLPQKKSLKKLLSVFNRAKLSLNYRKIGKKLREKQLKKQHIFDSGFIEQCPSSSSSTKSWHSDADRVDNEPSISPTFGTFGRPKCISEHCIEKSTAKNRMLLTEMLHASNLANDFVIPSNSDPCIFSRGTTFLDKENRQDIEPSSRTMSFSKSRVSCRYPLLPKHPHLIHSSIPKHPFVARTKMDQIEEKEAMAERTMQCDGKIEQTPDVLQQRCSSTLPIPVPQSALNTSYPRMSVCTSSSTSSNYDLPNSHKSTSALDEVFIHRQTSVYDVPRSSWLSRFTMDSSPPVYGDNLHEEILSCKPRFATVSPKNLRFSISQEKSRAIEKSFDS